MLGVGEGSGAMLPSWEATLPGLPRVRQPGDLHSGVSVTASSWGHDWSKSEYPGPSSYWRQEGEREFQDSNHGLIFLVTNLPSETIHRVTALELSHSHRPGNPPLETRPGSLGAPRWSWSQRPNIRAKGAPSALITKEGTKVLGALGRSRE